MKKYPCVYMRGGTSKALFFHRRDLPKDRSRWPEIFLKAMGSPDVKQIDGMGGTVSSTSKIAVISPSEHPGCDVDYDFFQVDILIANVDNSCNCGNISSAVGPFAIDEGLVTAVEPETTVRVFNTNTQKVIELTVRVKDGQACTEGDTEIVGVPGTGSPIDVLFVDPGGAKTGKLFPTGHKKEVFQVPDYHPTEVTIIDCTNPVVMFLASQAGIQGTELLELNNDKAFMEYVERIRGMAAEKLGFVEHWQEARVKSTSIPKVAIISAPQDFISLDGVDIAGENMDFCVRAVSVGSVHKAIPVTAASALGAAFLIGGTIIDEVGRTRNESQIVHIGNPSGITKIRAVVEGDEVQKAGVVRTARRIMDGSIYIR